MFRGDTLQITLAFDLDYVPDLTANGIVLSGTILQNDAPVFRFNTNDVDTRELSVTINNDSKNVARISISAVESKLFKDYYSEIKLYYSLKKANGEVKSNKVTLTELKTIQSNG